jgi:hypothetical protein
MGQTYLLQNQLGNTITLLDYIQNISMKSHPNNRAKVPVFFLLSHTGKVDVGVVEQKNLHFTTVVGINDTSTGIDEVLRGKARAGGNTAIYSETNIHALA